MQIPNFPTDNLYKFLALFGLVLMVYGSYMLSQTPESIYTEAEKLQVQGQILKYKLANDRLLKDETLNQNRITLLKDSLELDVSVKKLYREVDRFPNLLKLYISLLIIGAVLSILGFIQWYSKTQKFSDLILENESEKFISDKMISVHNLQFEKEFEVYKELWPDLINLRNSTHNLRPIFQSVDAFKSKEDIKKEKLGEFHDSFVKCLKTFDNNKPFYPEEIYIEIDAILRISRNEAFEFEHFPPIGSEYFDGAKENVGEIIEKIDIVCLRIRDRIGILKVND